MRDQCFQLGKWSHNSSIQVNAHQIINMLRNFKGECLHFSSEKKFQTKNAQNPSKEQACTSKPQHPHMHMQQHTSSPFAWLNTMEVNL